MVVHAFGYVAGWLGLAAVAEFLMNSSLTRDLIFTALFLCTTGWVVLQGIENGIERWSKRLMPTLVLLLVGLIIYMGTLAGASDCFTVYLVPDFSQLSDPSIYLAAMGQAFFRCRSA